MITHNNCIFFQLFLYLHFVIVRTTLRVVVKLHRSWISSKGTDMGATVFKSFQKLFKYITIWSRIFSSNLFLKLSIILSSIEIAMSKK